MSVFNTKTRTEEPNTYNFEAYPAYAKDPRTELIGIVLTSFLNDTFYQTGAQQVAKLLTLINKINDKKFIAQAAIFARNTFGMRSTSHILAGELSGQPAESWFSNFIQQVVVRPDDMLEILSYFVKRYHSNGKISPIPVQLRKALAKKLSTYSEYALAKYLNKGKEINMFDLINVVHPQRTEAINKIMTGKYSIPQTWETGLSEAGKSDNPEFTKKQVWKTLLEADKLGYLALVRNLRNIAQTNDTHIIDMACKALVNKKSIRYSKIFPFQLYSAYKEISVLSNASPIMAALEIAAEETLQNIPYLEGNTLIAIDHSKSLTNLISAKSTVTSLQIATVLGASLMKKFDDAELILFTTDARYRSVNKNMGLLAMAEDLQRNCVPQGTSFSSVFNLLNKKYDRIIFVTDSEHWQGNAQMALRNYRSKYSADPFIYELAVQENGTTVFTNRKHINMAGFSDKIYDFFVYSEKDPQALLSEINKIEL